MTKQQQNRIANELVFKGRNEKAKRLALEVLDDDSKATYKLNFVCECSNEHCSDNVSLTLREYKAVRSSDNHFVVKAGHEQTDIEAVVADEGYLIVEKYTIPPITDARLKPSR